MKRSMVFTFTTLFFLMSACAGAEAEGMGVAQEPDVPQEKPQPNDTILHLGYMDQSVEIRIRYPENKMIGTLLLFQGWNFPNTDWCEKTALCEKALLEGYALVCPEMGKSIYSENIYAQTRRDWLIYPTRTWLVDTLLPALQKMQLFREDEFSAIVGLSTGARGAFLVALDRPELFDAIACLSGDYDQSRFPEDNLYTGFFGTSASYPERWNGSENPMSRIDQLQAALYIGHGTKDKVVDVTHSYFLYEALKTRKFDRMVYHWAEEFGHDYTYWNSEVDAILEFFRKQR